jgi:hypothetical protein
MRQVRIDTVTEKFNKDKNSQPDEYSSFIPLTFESLLDYLYRIQSREIFDKQVARIPRMQPDETREAYL